MFARLRSWIEAQRQWKRDHLSTWSGWTESEPGQLSRFQQVAEPAISEAVSRSGGSLSKREVHQTSDGAYVYSSISPLGVDLWLHSDTVQIGSDKNQRRFEEWDYRTPQDMVAHAIQKIQEALRLHGRSDA